MTQVLHLYQLQKMDTQLDQLGRRLLDISNILKTDQTVQTAQNELTRRREDYHKAQQALNEVEYKVVNQRIKIETSESALYSGKIKNPKELQEIQQEIASLKKFLAELEDRQLEAMVALEAADAARTSAEQKLTQAQAELATRQAGLLGEKNQLERQQEKLNTERHACLSQISPESQLIYQRLREQKRGLAVALIEDGACSACGSALRPAELQSARSPTNIVYCSSCGRIVYAG